MNWLFVLLFSTGFAQAQTIVPTHTIRAQSILTGADLEVKPGEATNGISDIEAAIGLETRVTLYAGRPIQFADLGPPAVVDRNQIVRLGYSGPYLNILTDGRALARGGVGDIIQVMNLDSRTTVSGRILSDGPVSVSP